LGGGGQNPSDNLPNPSLITKPAITDYMNSISSKVFVGMIMSGAGEIRKAEHPGWTRGILQVEKWRYDPDR
jgi:hypothetical protein